MVSWVLTGRRLCGITGACGIHKGAAGPRAPQSGGELVPPTSSGSWDDYGSGDYYYVAGCGTNLYAPVSADSLTVYY
nr:hypothetical protein StreXyl84_00520 [Streptomyces sp. Xyl84]